MQFNSYEFVLLFLPAAVVLYFAAGRIRPVFGKLVLILLSILFYSYGRAEMLAYFGLSILLNCLFALFIRSCKIRREWHLTLPVAVNVGLLLYFKYLNFAILNLNAVLGTGFELKELVLPLGISFYTFQQIAYLAAVWKGDLRDAGLIDYLTFILYFPKLIMGPLADPVEFISQINRPERKRIQAKNLAVGIRLFSIGLVKKVLFADTFAKAVAWGYRNYGALTSMDWFLIMLFYTFEIYFDFSGYSDMAVGISSMLNLDLPANFDSPYKAVSIRDFWKRWHISLTRFLTRYIYIPLGGSRRGKLLTYVNTMVVFLISGLWHGASWSFVLWGFLHGALSCFDRAFARLEEKIWKPVRWLCSFLAVSVLWLLFDVGSVRLWLSILREMVTAPTLSVSAGIFGAFQTAGMRLAFRLPGLQGIAAALPGLGMIVFLLAACFICFVPENACRAREKLDAGSLLISAVSLITGILCLGAESTFVYFGF